MNHHTQLLNYLVDKYKLDSYLEIGCQNKANNFNKIKARVKYCVDPDRNAKADFVGTSDSFFANVVGTWQLIFIDGDHTKEQVKRDFENSLKVLDEGNSFIVLHDTLPENEQGTLVPRQTKMWWGNVYQFAMTLGTYQDIDYRTVNIDQGCTVIWRGQMNGPYINLKNQQPNWETYVNHRVKFLRVIQPSEIEKYL